MGIAAVDIEYAITVEKGGRLLRARQRFRAHRHLIYYREFPNRPLKKHPGITMVWLTMAQTPFCDLAVLLSRKIQLHGSIQLGPRPVVVKKLHRHCLLGECIV